MNLSKAVEHEIGVWHVLDVEDLHHVGQALVDPILLTSKD